MKLRKLIKENEENSIDKLFSLLNEFVNISFIIKKDYKLNNYFYGIRNGVTYKIYLNKNDNYIMVQIYNLIGINKDNEPKEITFKNSVAGIKSFQRYVVDIDEYIHQYDEIKKFQNRFDRKG